jgi:hypothetical protein
LEDIEKKLGGRFKNTIPVTLIGWQLIYRLMIRIYYGQKKEIVKNHNYCSI